MIAALIPARAGSKGIPRKNLQIIDGYPLIAYSIMAAKKAHHIDRIIVSTDCEKIARVSRSFGAEVPFLRPAEYAQDNSPDKDFVLHAMHWLQEQEGLVPEFFIHLRPTTPLREPNLIDEAIIKMQKNHPATSLRSAHSCSESPFKWFLLQENGFFSGINTKNMDALNEPRQAFPQVYIPNGYVDILKTAHIQATGNIHGNNVLSFITPACIEIDTINDLAQLKFELQNKSHVLTSCLKMSKSESAL